MGPYTWPFSWGGAAYPPPAPMPTQNQAAGNSIFQGMQARGFGGVAIQPQTLNAGRYSDLMKRFQPLGAPNGQRPPSYTPDGTGLGTPWWNTAKPGSSFQPMNNMPSYSQIGQQQRGVGTANPRQPWQAY